MEAEKKEELEKLRREYEERIQEAEHKKEELAAEQDEVQARERDDAAKEKLLQEMNQQMSAIEDRMKTERAGQEEALKAALEAKRKRREEKVALQKENELQRKLEEKQRVEEEMSRRRERMEREASSRRLAKKLVEGAPGGSSPSHVPREIAAPASIPLSVLASKLDKEGVEKVLKRFRDESLQEDFSSVTRLRKRKQSRCTLLFFAADFCFGQSLAESITENVQPQDVMERVTGFLDRLAADLIETMTDDTSKDKLMKQLVEEQDSLQRAMADEKARQAAELNDRIKNRRQARLQRKMQRDMMNRMQTKEQLLISEARTERGSSVGHETDIIQID
eukprot:CAMPEP_0113895042 /NCGR_PEP_ID=MMETSP0780_2-20120614/17107_1 /TAXON_ID=652834 /ORGANISM="Palpitomonas bilix" /LENGTH=335 /DNA_ID=CAMNT_0000885757 /DNA_START=6 /DNA_END=1014 /DNA_ORIENTATION=- /assembly_acc=CAM_ASM_000599